MFQRGELRIWGAEGCFGGQNGAFGPGTPLSMGGGREIPPLHEPDPAGEGLWCPRHVAKPGLEVSRTLLPPHLQLLSCKAQPKYEPSSSSCHGATEEPRFLLQQKAAGNQPAGPPIPDRRVWLSHLRCTMERHKKASARFGAWEFWQLWVEGKVAEPLCYPAQQHRR